MAAPLDQGANISPDGIPSSQPSPLEMPFSPKNFHHDKGGNADKNLIPFSPPAAQQHPKDTMVSQPDMSDFIEKVSQELGSEYRKKQAKYSADVVAGKTDKTCKRDQTFTDALDAAVRAGHVEPRGGLGQKFERSMSADERAKYKSLTTRDKAAFRTEWAKKKYEELIGKKEKVEEWKKIDITKGRYLSAAKVFLEEGGTSTDIEPVQKLITKCFKMGEPFIKFNSFTERWDILYIQHHMQEEFHRCWRLYETEQTERPVSEEDDGGKEPAEEPARKKGKTQLKSLTNQEEDLKREKKDKEKKDSQEKKDDSMKQLCAAAAKTKRSYLSTWASSQGLIEQIKDDASWSWANNDTVMSKLRMAQQDLKDALTPFARNFMNMEMGTLKKQYDQASLNNQFSKLSLDLDDKIECVRTETAQLIRMHKSRL